LILAMEDRLVTLCGASHRADDDDPTVVALREAFAR
jgi:hypothetical protein